MSFAGMNVVSLESRRAGEMAKLIRNQRGEPFVAPSMRGAPRTVTVVARGPREALRSSLQEMVVTSIGPAGILARKRAQ